MKKLTTLISVSALVLSFSLNSLADYRGRNNRHGQLPNYGNNYGHGRHGNHHHNGNHNGNGEWTDGDTAAAAAVAAGLGATLLSLSLESATRSAATETIQQAETEALTFDGQSDTSEVFQTAKQYIQVSEGRVISDEEAAMKIVELNQQLRAQ